MLNKAIVGGATSVEFSKLVQWLTSELARIVGIDDHVNAIAGAT